MDPVSLLGTVVSCVGVVTTLTMNVSRYVTQIKGAPQTLHDYQQELMHFEDLLTQVQEALEQNKGKGASTESSRASANNLIGGCRTSLQRVQQEFPRPRGPSVEISIMQRITVVIKKDTFVASRAHLQAVSQTLTLLLQKISIAESINIAQTADRIQASQDQMTQSQKKMQEDIAKFGLMITGMQRQLMQLEGQASELECKSQILSEKQPEDPELSALEQVAQETYSGVNNIRMYCEAARLFEESMKAKAQSVWGSEEGSLSTRIQEWNNGVPSEPGTAQVDEAIDMRSPTQSRISSEPGPPLEDDDLDDDPKYQDPEILLGEVEFYQRQVDRQTAVGAFKEAKLNQRHSIALLEKLEQMPSPRGQPFERRVEMMQRLARITMQEGHPESYGEARRILHDLKQHVKGEDVVMRAELDHSMAVTYVEEWKATEAGGARPLPDGAIVLLKRAERWATQALWDRRELAGPPRDLMRESIIFIVDLYDRLQDPAKRFAFTRKYGEFLSDDDAPTERPRSRDQPKADLLQPRPRPRSSTGSEVPHKFTDEEVWLQERGFDLGPHDYINTRHEKTQLTPLIAAIVENNQTGDSMVQRFVTYMGADPNRTDGLPEYGLAPLVWSVKFGNMSVLELLCKKGADLLFYDARRQRTALHAAIDTDSTGVLDRLYRAEPALLPLGDHAGQTALHRAVEKGSLKAVRFLLNRGADVDAQDGDGQTPLHLALQAHWQEITNHLLTRHPDMARRNRQRRTPLEESREVNGRNSMLFFTLKDYLAQAGRAAAASPGRVGTLASLSPPQADPVQRVVSNATTAAASDSGRHSSSAASRGPGSSGASLEPSESRASKESKRSIWGKLRK